MRKSFLVLGLFLGLMVSCSREESPETQPDQTGTAGEALALNLDVGTIPDELAIFRSGLSKYINVFGVHIIATAATPDEKVEHAAHVMAQYLDNDANGTIDDPAVVAAMVQARAFMVMGSDENELESLDPEPFELAGYGAGQGLFGTETNPSVGFDASLEEVLHLITDYGYTAAYESHFGVDAGSAMTNAMDTARGGQFIESSEEECEGGGNCALPENGYPEQAWYTYDDDTCSYNCMATEYFYWVLTSLLGAQSGRCDEIAEEWQPCTPDRVLEMDSAAHTLFTATNAGYVMPTVLPDGDYQGPTQ